MLVPALLASLAGCSDEGRPPNTSSPASPIATPSTTSSSPRSAEAPPPPPGYTDGSGINEHYPDLSPKPLASDLEGTEAGARNVLLAFARAIELREFDQAWDMLDETTRQQWSKASLNALFRGLHNIKVAVPGGQMEAAAGSLYYTSQAEVTAIGTNGQPVRMEGKLALRRVNDVPGATQKQLRWHVYEVDLKRAP